MTEVFAVRARSFIAALDLPPAPARTRDGPAAALPDPAAPAVTTGQNLIEFAPAVDAAIRPAVTDALLLAQLAADKAGAASPDGWYESHRSVLAHLGFVSSGLTRTAQDFSTTNEDLNEAILPVITAAFAGAAVPALVIATLEQLSAASPEKPWLKLFEQETRHVGARQFQISMVDSAADALVVRMLGFALEISQEAAQILFFRHARDTGAVERLEGSFSVPAATLAGLAPELATKLAERRHAYLAALEI
jgi:hypothetical protein